MKYGPGVVATNPDERILEYLSRRAATPEHLANDLGVSSGEIQTVLAALNQKGWINVSAAWYGNDPSSAITVVTLAPAGRKETERREALASRPEPIELSREELAAELRRLGMTEQQIAHEPNLRGDRFYFWPSIGAFQMLPDES